MLSTQQRNKLVETTKNYFIDITGINSNIKLLFVKYLPSHHLKFHSRDNWKFSKIEKGMCLMSRACGKRQKLMMSGVYN